MTAANREIDLASRESRRRGPHWRQGATSRPDPVRPPANSLAVSKTVVRLFGVPRVRISPPPLSGPNLNAGRRLSGRRVAGSGPASARSIVCRERRIGPGCRMLSAQPRSRRGRACGGPSAPRRIGVLAEGQRERRPTSAERRGYVPVAAFVAVRVGIQRSRISVRRCGRMGLVR